MIVSPLAVLVALAAIVYGSILLEERFAVVRALGSMLFAIVLAAVAANIGLLPSSSPAYDALNGISVNVGIALILLGIDFRSVLGVGAGMLKAFGLGALGTAVGAIVATLLIHDAIGPEAWKLAGQYTGPTPAVA